MFRYLTITKSHNFAGVWLEMVTLKAIRGRVAVTSGFVTLLFSVTSVFGQVVPELPNRAIEMGCRLVNVIQNVGSGAEPKNEYWTIVEFEGHRDLSKLLDFSAAQPFPLGDYTWIDVTGVADIANGSESIRLMNKVRVFKDNQTNDFYVGLPDFNQIWITINHIGLGLKHESSKSYDDSIMLEVLGCHLIP